MPHLSISYFTTNPSNPTPTPPQTKKKKKKDDDEEEEEEKIEKDVPYVTKMNLSTDFQVV